VTIKKIPFFTIAPSKINTTPSLDILSTSRIDILKKGSNRTRLRASSKNYSIKRIMRDSPQLTTLPTREMFRS
jgi:hypothetical protein